MRPRIKPKDLLRSLPVATAYTTAHGVMLRGLAEKVLKGRALRALEGRVRLIFTSPPFPLNTKKKYGNLQGDAYLKWLADFGQIFRKFLTDDGSIVIELGNSWVPGEPVMSTLALKALLRFQEENKFHLCQEFICHNPARLPGPAQWVTVERIRLKDSYTRLWWLAASSRPYANNKSVLKAYSPSMEKLLKSGKFNAGKRPSEHHINKTAFAKNQGGAIPPSVLSISNTHSQDAYQLYCRKHEIVFHPARMPNALPEFFIKFLTTPGDIVLDPFGGSNTTGAMAEALGRRWVTIEPERDYIAGSLGRFERKRVRLASAIRA